MIDGGYFALKGFAYQFDKAIVDILKSENVNSKFGIEQIQDLNHDSIVVQVKYKETQTFTPSKVKQPILQLIEEFKKDSSKDYVLYAHFKDLNGYEGIISSGKSLTILGLEKILGKNNTLSKTLKQDFLNKFTLDFSLGFNKQFEQAVTLIQELDFVGASRDVAMFYHSQIFYFLNTLVISTQDPSKRTISKQDIIRQLRHGRKLIFTDAYQDFKNEQGYFKLLKKVVPTIKKNKETLIVLGEVGKYSNDTYYNFIDALTEKQYTRARYDVKPITFVIPTNRAIEIKKFLISSNYIINDGFEHLQFNEQIFYRKHLITRKSTANGKATDTLQFTSFKIRILSDATFKGIEDHKEPYITYYIDADTFDFFKSESFIRIDKLEFTNALKLL
jgi:hypothetical protein